MASSAGGCGVGTPRHGFIPGPHSLRRGEVVILKLSKGKSGKEFRGGRTEDMASCASASASSIENMKDKGVTFRPSIDPVSFTSRMSCVSASYAGRSYCSGTISGLSFNGRCSFDCSDFSFSARTRPRGCVVAEASSSDSSNIRVGASNGRAEITDILSGTKIGARERRLQKSQEEKRRKQGQGQGQYPEWATILENACKDDVELREIIGDSLGNPEEMRKRVEERVRKKGRDVLSPLTGSSVPMSVTFRADFDATDANVWLELYGSPSDKDLETIGSVLRSWYLLGRLGSFNSMNMQLTQLPIDARLTYNNDKAADALPSLFHNISDLEFQDNWGRFWIDFGTSDPVAMDVLINALSAVSSEHVGIKQLVFGGQKLGDWAEGMVDPEDGYRCYRI